MKKTGDFSCFQMLLENRFPVTHDGENSFFFVCRENVKDALRRLKSS